MKSRTVTPEKVVMIIKEANAQFIDSQPHAPDPQEHYRNAFDLYSEASFLLQAFEPSKELLESLLFCETQMLACRLYTFSIPLAVCHHLLNQIEDKAKNSSYTLNPVYFSLINNNVKMIKSYMTDPGSNAMYHFGYAINLSEYLANTQKLAAFKPYICVPDNLFAKAELIINIINKLISGYEFLHQQQIDFDKQTFIELIFSLSYQLPILLMSVQNQHTDKNTQQSIFAKGKNCHVTIQNFLKSMDIPATTAFINNFKFISSQLKDLQSTSVTKINIFPLPPTNPSSSLIKQSTLRF